MWSRADRIASADRIQRRHGVVMVNIAAAGHCYQVCRAAGNKAGALRHLNTIRAELRWRTALRKFRVNCLGANPDRVDSIFDCAPPIEDF